MEEEQVISKNDIKRERAADAARRSRVRKIIIAVIIAAVIGGLIYVSIVASRRNAQNTPGESYANQGQEHVPLGREFAYNSNPPASGPHYASPANWGVYDYEANDKLFIHNMEHGGVWIAYRPTVSTNVVAHLKSIVDEFGGSKIVMAPRAANDSDVAVAAWTRLLKINLIGGDITEDQMNQIRVFYKAYKNKGPEFVPDTMPGVDPKAIQ
ncbi:MAG: DUF3105 domain-containing protein [Candidatus Sungiibacteriota bacterium]